MLLLHFFQVFKRQRHKTSLGAIALFCLKLLYRNTYRPLQERSPHKVTLVDDDIAENVSSAMSEASSLLPEDESCIISLFTRQTLWQWF
ncbi:hypothetical protein H1Q63_01735 [Desmonostoc muscorum CCALA 125]|nr:hypothetical protein [Desmonostoc muscorum CCALA 125]